MIISILNQKGGSGKTTLAVNITREYTLRGFSSLLVDSDRQGSAQRWHEAANGELIDMTCLPMNTLHKDILKYKDKYNRIIIDGLPQISSITISAITTANIILIPVQPSPYDIWATEGLVRLVKERMDMTEGKTKAAFIVSRKIKGTNIGKEIYADLARLELPVFISGTHQRVEYANCVNKGLTVMEGNMDAAKEISSIVNEIEEFING